MYGLLEGQFKRYFEMAEQKKGITGENLLVLLERRLDNAIMRLGFASSRKQARQLVRHNHILVNDKKVNIPSFLVVVGDMISVREKSRSVPCILESQGALGRRGVPSWLELDADGFKGVVRSLPKREELTMPIQEQLIVELYSK